MQRRDVYGKIAKSENMTRSQDLAGGIWTMVDNRRELQEREGSIRLQILCKIYFATLLTISCVARADEFGLQFAAGTANHDVKKADVGLAWDPGLSWWHIDGYHFTVIGEAHTAYWNIREDHAVHPDIWEFGFTPVFRIIKDAGWIRPYFEVGVGVRFLSHVRETEDRTLSSSFQFADMVGVGVQFGERQQYQAGLRFQHLSNAGIKRPNPGIDFSELYVQYNF